MNEKRTAVEALEDQRTDVVLKSLVPPLADMIRRMEAAHAISSGTGKSHLTIALMQIHAVKDTLFSALEELK